MEKFEPIELFGIRLFYKDDREKLLEEYSGICSTDGGNSEDILQVLAHSCKNFKIIHPSDSPRYKACPSSRFLKSLSYKSELVVKYNEFGYSFDEDCRIIIKDV